MPISPTEPDCILCKIVTGQIPCFKVFEDDQVLAFLDIGPLAVGHTLVVPKGHYATVMETPAGVLGAVNERIPAIARAVLAVTGAPACHILTNNGPEAMQTIPHLHYHIIPRQAGDTFHIPWNATPLDKATAPALVQAIQAQLGSG